MNHRISVLPACVILLASWHCAQGAGRPRFEAMLANGSRIEGEKLQEWHNRTAQPKLDGKPLLDPGNPLVWLRDRKVGPAGPPAALVETTCGDRIAGEVTGYRPAGAQNDESLPAHFLVRTQERYRHPEDGRAAEVRVAERFVRRIVWQRQFGAGERCEPGTVYYRDGRAVKFRAARFAEDSVRLLLEEGARKATFAEIAEIHLPRRDPWLAYYDELATVNPDLQARMLQVETTAGLAATSSLARFEARDGGNAGESDRWLHAVQPAWSLDPLWIPSSTIWIRRTFPPHQVPLSLVSPEKVQARGMLGGGSWHWQANRNVQGGPLQSGGQACGWGLGVHAFSELHFPLPASVRSFRTRVGLDDLVGSGGCVRARIFAGSTQTPPLYESPFLVGSAKALDPGTLALKGPAQGQKTLILQVDPGHEGRPAGADPFDIRDVLDWIEPALELDPGAIKTEVDKRLLSPIAAWDGWQLTVEKDGTAPVTSLWDAAGPEKGLFVTGVRAEKQPFSLRRSLQVEPEHHWLAVAASVYPEQGDKPKIQIRVDGVPMAEYPVPQRTDPRMQPALFFFPLTWFQGRKIDLEIAQSPGNPQLFVYWREVRLADQLPTLFRLFDRRSTPVALDPDSKGAATLVGDDHYSGTCAVKITPSGRFRVATFDPPLRVRTSPAWGEYRYLRFAVRKAGKGRVCLELERDGTERGTACFDLGQGEPCLLRAKRLLSSELPDEWIVVTADVAGSFGDREVNGLTLSVPDGEYALFDDLYLSRTGEEFKLLRPEPLPQMTNPQTRKTTFDAVLKRATPITVAIEADGRFATGIVIGGEGHVLTAGHVVVKPGREVAVQLADGRKLKATTLGVDRALDCGIVKIAEKVELNGSVLRAWSDAERNYLYVGMAHPAARDKGQSPQTQIVSIRHAFGDMIWGEWDPPEVAAGGPLLNWEGAVTGVHVRTSRFGGMIYSKATSIQGSWARMVGGEVWGQWLLGTGPMLPAAFDTARGGCRVTEVATEPPVAPAVLQEGDVLETVAGRPVTSIADVDRALADKNPGDEVALDVKRSAKRLPVKVRLLPRRP